MTKIPIRIEDIEKVPSVSEEIKVMLRSNPNVSFDSDVPYCYLSRLESSYGELTIGCNLKNMVCLFYSTTMLLYLFTPNSLSVSCYQCLLSTMLPSCITSLVRL